MKEIEFVGGVAEELAEVMNDNNIVATCIDGNVCEIADEDFAKLKEVAPAAFDGNDIVVIAEHIDCDGYDVRVREDADNYYVDFQTGLGEGIYPKNDWTLKNALYDQEHIYEENK